MASATREPLGSSTMPGRSTPPSTSTTTVPGGALLGAADTEPNGSKGGAGEPPGRGGDLSGARRPGTRRRPPEAGDEGYRSGPYLPITSGSPSARVTTPGGSAGAPAGRGAGA